MKKLTDCLKKYKTGLIIAAIIVALVMIVCLSGGVSSNITVNSSTDKSQTEIKLEQILSSIDGVGESMVMINESENGINGVVIVCRGADNIMVRNDIINAVSTALNIKKNIIAVYAMN